MEPELLFDFDFNKSLLINCERNLKGFFFSVLFYFIFLCLAVPTGGQNNSRSQISREKINTAKNWKIRLNPLFSLFP